MYSIGEISKMFDLPISTIRYYDRLGILPALNRANGNRRQKENCQPLSARRHCAGVCAFAFRKQKPGIISQFIKMMK